MAEPVYVTCETAAAIALHIREVGDTPISYSGFAKRPYALCGTQVAWDTHITVDAASCGGCQRRKERMEAGRTP